MYGVQKTTIFVHIETMKVGDQKGQNYVHAIHQQIRNQLNYILTLYVTNMQSYHHLVCA